MKDNIDKALFLIREYYIRKIKRRIGNPVHLARLSDPQEVSDVIYSLLNSGKPCMIARYGYTEFRALLNYLCILEGPHNMFKYLTGETHAWWCSKVRMNNLSNLSGVFPVEDETYMKFCRMLLNDTASLDILASWINEEVYLEERLKGKTKIFLPFLEPYWADCPWSRVLEGKKVLVVHPFSQQIEYQYNHHREELFTNSKVLPKFHLEVLTAVQSLGGKANGFSTWFEALEYMKDEINRRDYDVCIIGCGAYGFHLAAHVKRQGKKAVHMGGATQLMFGIKGNRWEDPNYGVREWGLPYGFYTRLFNEYWIKPGAFGKPKNADEVEGACYW